VTVSNPSTVEYIVDQQIRQVQNVQALQPINGPQVVGVDGSKTPPQVRTMVSPMDGELPRPSSVGNDFYRKAREIRRDPTIRMVRELAMAPLLMAEWEYEADEDAPVGAKELVEKIMSKMRLPLLRQSLCGMTDFGWQPFEIIAEQREDGTSEPRLKPLLQDTTSILVNAADGSFFGLRQTPTIGVRIGWIYLLDQECLVISQDVEGTNWYGEPTLRSLERVYDESEVVSKTARKYDAKIAGTHWVIYYPLGTSDYGGQTLDNGEIAQKLLQQAEAVGGIAVPRSVVNALDAMNAAMAQSEASQWKIELLTDGGKGQQPFTDRQKYLDVLKVRAFGFPERAILEGQFGTKAEAESHGDVAVSNLEVRHAMVVLQYNLKIVDLILAWNYGPQSKGKVRIKPSPLADDTKAFFRQVYLAMIANPQGFMTEMSAVDLTQIRDRLGLPEHPMMQHMQDAWGSGVDPVTGQLLGPIDDGSGMPALPPPEALPAVGFAFDHKALSLTDDVDAAASEADKPTDAQREAGNYRKGHVRIHGLDISIETPRGHKRKKKWPKLPAHYGYFKGSVGADGDHVDVFVGPKPATEVAFVANMKGKDGKFDEHKVMLGFRSIDKARSCLSEAYGEADHRIGRLTPLTIPQLKEWLSLPATKALSFNPDQPRVGKGEKGGGQWAKAVAVGKRFGIPAEAVHDLLSTHPDVLAKRDKYSAPSSDRDNPVGPTLDYEKHPLGTAKIDSSRHATGETNDAYVDYLREFDPQELKTSEHEDGMNKSESVRAYAEWMKAGHKAPPISVFDSSNGNGDLVSTNRRRVLAARKAGTKLNGWHGVTNKETGLPLKYGDVKKAAAEIKE